MPTDEELLEYLEKRDLIHARDVQRVIDQLSPFEARLLREAAVMGHVLGQRYPAGERLPKDFVMIRAAVDAAIAGDPDKFPIIHYLLRGPRQPHLEDQINGYIPGDPNRDTAQP